MAHVFHHHGARSMDVPRRTYWLAAIGLALLALLVAFTVNTAGNPAMTAAHMSDMQLPFVPFLPLV